jgi:hypothetical protein
MRFDSSSERRRYIGEINEFIDSEIKHAAQLINKFSRDARDQRFVASARRYVDALIIGNTCIATANTANGAASEHLDNLLEPFPDILLDLTTALFQRAEAEPTRPFALASRRSIFVPSEVSPEYAVTIRAAEAVNHFYHDRVKGFYPPTTDCHPPLVNLSGGLVANIRQQKNFAAATVGKSPDRTAIQRTLAIVKTILDVSCITLPRWSSQHIRIYALIAHEHFHRVLTVTDYVNAWIRTAYNESKKGEGKKVTKGERLLDIDWKSRNRKVREAARNFYLNSSRPYEKQFGTALVKLAALRYTLTQRIWNFLARRKVRPLPYENPQPLEVISNIHGDELLADLGALVIAGPAFAIAFRTVYPPRNPEYELQQLFDASTPPPELHPPALLRVHLHEQILSDLGFKTLSKRLTSDSSALWATGKKVRSGFIDAYARFLRDRTTGAGGNIADILVTVVEIAGESSAYNLKARAETNARNSSEKDLLQWWTEITRQIEEEGKVFTRDVQSIPPADAINAIWWKRALQHNRDPKNRLAWRVALRNYRG